jgi:hypothetical protein
MSAGSSFLFTILIEKLFFDENSIFMLKILSRINECEINFTHETTAPTTKSDSEEALHSTSLSVARRVQPSVKIDFFSFMLR